MLLDVARIIDGVEDMRQAAWWNETPAVIVNIQRQPGANTIRVVDEIHELLPQLEANLPADIRITTLTDLTIGIQSSVRAVELEHVEACLDTHARRRYELVAHAIHVRARHFTRHL